MKTSRLPRSAVLPTLLCLALLALSGCHKNLGEEDAKPGAAAQTSGTDKAPTDKRAEGEVTLSPEQIEKIGLTVAAVMATEYAAQATGYGTVLAHDSIAQALAELISAQATEKQSRSALARARRLSGTAGAVSADIEEASARQAEVDDAALTLAKQRLSATFGLKPPWSGGGNMGLLHGLADGNPKLVRLTFPIGALDGDMPKSLLAARIGSASGKRWKMTSVWAAPADANVPGRSFFAILNGADVGEGERILVWAPVGGTEAGVVIPQPAVVISDGKYWCYLEEKAGTYLRTEIDTHRPWEDGYFLSEGVNSGDKVVIKGAAQLLAQESNSGGDAD
jgi:hypothetical protein